MEILSNILLVVLCIVSVVLIVAIVLLPPKSQGMGIAIGGEETTIFGRRKSRGFTAKLENTINISAVIFMLAAFVYNIVLKLI